MEKLATRLNASPEEKTGTLANWKDSHVARKYNLPTEPTGFFNKVENLQMKEAGKTKGLDSQTSTLTDLLPKEQLSGNKEAVDAHFSNLASRIIREFDALGFAPEDRGTAFKEVFAELVVREMDLTKAKLITPDQFEQAARRFTSDSRTDKAEIMQIIADTLSELGDPNSDVMMRIKVNGFEELISELGNLKPTGDTDYLRSTTSNELFLTGAAQGGYKIIESSRDFVKTLPQNLSFRAVENRVEGMLKDLQGDRVKFGNLTTPDTVRSLGTLAMQMISAISRQDMASDFRSFVADVMDTIKSQVESGAIGKDVGMRAHKLFGESSILLRYVVPEVAQGKMEGAGAQRSLMVLSQFVQMIANDQDAPATFDQDMKQAYNEVKASVREKLQDFLTLLDAPSPGQFSKDLDKALSRYVMAEVKEMEESLSLPDDDDDDIEVENGEVDPETLNAQKLINEESDKARKIGSDDAQPKNNPQNNPEQGKIAQNTLPKEVVIEEIDMFEDEDDSEDPEVDLETLNAQMLVDPKSIRSKDEVVSDKINNSIDELQRPKKEPVFDPLNTPPNSNPPN
ncbi:MAG: hypothetical protein H9533_20590 [Rhodobacteraceae bacterium]|nr:hypothetical protein [Paracoccaceae bacterium]